MGPKKWILGHFEKYFFSVFHAASSLVMGYASFRALEHISHCKNFSLKAHNPVEHKESKMGPPTGIGKGFNFLEWTFLGSFQASPRHFILGYVDQQYSGLCRPPIPWPLWAL